jgi:hypothetical protein
VNYLRRKLHDPPPGILIRTVRGQGYTVPSEAELALIGPTAAPILHQVATIGHPVQFDALPVPEAL